MFEICSEKGKSERIFDLLQEEGEIYLQQSAIKGLNEVCFLISLFICAAAVTGFLISLSECYQHFRHSDLVIILFLEQVTIRHAEQAES